MSTTTHEDVLRDTIKDKDEIISILNQRIDIKDELIEALSIKLAEKDNQVYDQIAKTYSVEDKYLQLVSLVETYHKEMRRMVRQLDGLHSNIVLDGLYNISKGVEQIRHDLEEEIK